MRLYAQTILIVAVMTIAVAVVLLVAFELTVMESYSSLEQEYAQQDLLRAENAINTEVARLCGISMDWAIWDDTYYFIQDRNQAYKISNFAPSTLEGLHIAAIAIYDKDGNCIAGMSTNQSAGTTGEICDGIDQIFQSSGLNVITDSGVSGIISGDKDPLIVASSPVMTSHKQGPAMGMVVVGSYLDEERIRVLSEDLLRTITITAIDSGEGKFDDQTVSSTDISTDISGGSHVINDISGRPVLLLSVHEPGDLSRSGLYSRIFFLTSLLLLVLLFMGLASWLLNRIIISPLKELNKDLLQIGYSGSLSGRIPEERQDEIGDLTTSINGMLASLEQAQQERLTSEQRLSRLIDLVEEGICLIGPDGLIWFANPTLASIFGTSVHDLTGTPIHALIAPEGTVSPGDMVGMCPSSLTSGQHEYHNKTETGRDIWVRIATAPYPLETGKMGYLCVVTDITPFKHAERNLLLSNKKLALLGSMTRHDIVNQLTTIRGMLGLIKRKNQDHSLDQLIGSAEDASERINKHIEFSKEYQKAGIEAPRWQDLRTVWNLAYAMSRRRGLTFTVTGDDFEVYADQLLQKVFYNLIENSLRHGKDVFYITVSTKMDGSDLLILYEDDGGGVVDTMKERIFERGVGTGTGWGLFFVQEVLELTRMSIKESGTYGIGVLFTITVPEGVFRPVFHDEVDTTEDVYRSSDRHSEDYPGN
jgi:PAS domain S-box-containing protein